MVRVAFAAAAAAMAGSVFAAPAGAPVDMDALTKRANLDVTVLQFALTLEHLENVFYKNAIKKFSVEDFQHAGYSANYYNNLKYIAFDEQTHVEALEAALRAAGQTPTKPCTYSFPYTDVKSFITLSSVIENVGTSAYLGAAPLITSDAYLTVAGAILAVEALHTSYQRAAIGEIPMANAFQTPLDPNAVYTLATMFIVSCPASNPKFPFTQFPYLATDGKTCTCEEISCGAPSSFIKAKRDSGWHWPGPGGWHPQPACRPPVAGATVTFTADGKVPSGSYVTFVNGLTVKSVVGSIHGNTVSVKIPPGFAGQTYVFITSARQTTFNPAQVKYGPAILEVKPPAPAIDFSEH